MKIFAVIFLAISVVIGVQSVSFDVSQLKDFIRSGLDGKFLAFLENFKDVIKNGSESLGIPPLDPYKSKPLELPIDVKDIISANVSVESVGVLGLSNYIIEKANFTLNGFKMNVSLDWSEIQGKLNGYSILGKLMDFLDVYGIGDADINVKNLQFACNISLTYANKRLSVKTLKTNYFLGGFKFDIEGLYNDADASKIISLAVSEFVLEMLETKRSELLVLLDGILTDKLDEFLSDKSLGDLIDIISNKPA